MDYLPPPKKHFGQHFLTDPGLLDRFASELAALGCPPEAPVVEIGPGRGDFTAALRRAGHPITAIELDGELIPALEQRFASGGVSLIRADALRYDYGSFPAPLWLAGNLPYQIATPLMVHILRTAPQLRGAIFLIQKEMSARLIAPPSTKEYAAVTALMQSHWKIRKLFHVGRSHFTPPPRVDSTLITVVPRPEALVPRERFNEHEALLRRAFGERRKTLANNFKRHPAALAALKAAGIDPVRRAETLSPEEFAKVLAALPAGGIAAGSAESRGD